jgi:hypothetical protein
MPVDDNIDRWAVKHQDDDAFDFISPFRAGGVAFSGKTITPVAIGVLVLSLATKSETMQEGLFGCVTATARAASFAPSSFILSSPALGRSRESRMLSPRRRAKATNMSSAFPDHPIGEDTHCPGDISRTSWPAPSF